eukprot:TRINITY_DN30716_c0_g1_i1.p1 TRINITY_DN30716_c0_g1~~TRINITY_DN30716_c0_g1_i1.p1  ORF type:complete len:323 (+),score=35.58 TRINITY_DN30716_c0_g1_i1:83-970(+)
MDKCCTGCFAQFFKRNKQASRNAERSRLVAEDTAMEVRARSDKLGPMEIQEKLRESRIFESVSVVRHVGSGSAAAPSATDGDSIDSRMITNYLDSVEGGENPESSYLLEIKGPITETDETSVAKGLDLLETVLLDDSDTRRFHLEAIRAVNLEVRFPLTSFLNNLLMSGSVTSVTLMNCVLTPPVLGTGLHVTRSKTLTNITLKSCSLTDAHLSFFITSLQENGTLLPHLESFNITGSFTNDTVLPLLDLLEEEAPKLRSLTFPRRAENFVKQHLLCATLPHLVLNGKKVRHVLT